MAPDINVKLIDMPTTIKGTSTMNEDGSYTIFLNARLNQKQQNNAYIHELGHILRLDFESKHENVSLLEYYAHTIKGGLIWANTKNEKTEDIILL